MITGQFRRQLTIIFTISSAMLTDLSQNTTLTNGSTCLVDGAKRDRVVWPGDMIISIQSGAVSTCDMISAKNSIASLLAIQGSDGKLLCYRPTYNKPAHTYTSFTYHLYTIFDLFYYYEWSGDVDYLTEQRSRVKAGLIWSLSYVDSSGLQDVTATLD